MRARGLARFWQEVTAADARGSVAQFIEKMCRDSLALETPVASGGDIICSVDGFALSHTSTLGNVVKPSDTLELTLVGRRRGQVPCSRADAATAVDEEEKEEDEARMSKKRTPSRSARRKAKVRRNRRLLKEKKAELLKTYVLVEEENGGRQTNANAANEGGASTGGLDDEKALCDVGDHGRNDDDDNDDDDDDVLVEGGVTNLGDKWELMRALAYDGAAALDEGKCSIDTLRQGLKLVYTIIELGEDLCPGQSEARVGVLIELRERGQEGLPELVIQPACDVRGLCDSARHLAFELDPIGYNMRTGVLRLPFDAFCTLRVLGEAGTDDADVRSSGDADSGDARASGQSDSEPRTALNASEAAKAAEAATQRAIARVPAPAATPGVVRLRNARHASIGHIVRQIRDAADAMALARERQDTEK